MGKTHTELDEGLIDFMARQHVFFVGTAPLQEEGLVNISPKGLHSLMVLDPRTIAYVDVTGSGIETVAHLRENGRIVVMFCAFEGAPKILAVIWTRDGAGTAGSRLRRTRESLPAATRRSSRHSGGCQPDCRFLRLRGAGAAL